MIHRDELIGIIETYFGQEALQTAREKDTHLANGIQIHGKEEVETIVIGVSATVEFFKKAEERKADFILTKHPMLIAPTDQCFDPSTQQRLRMVFQNNWTVGGYHYLLDVHPEVGNVPTLFKQLNIKLLQPLKNGWGYVGELSQPMPIDQLAKKLSSILHHDVFQVIPPGKEEIQRIGMVSGGGIPHAAELMEMLNLHLDLYITGEISEWTVHIFKESGMAYFAAGHHATEVLGPQTFAQVLQKLVGNKAKVEFINVWNEI